MVGSKKNWLRLATIGGILFVGFSTWGAFHYVVLLAQQQMDIETAKVRQSFSTQVNASESVTETYKTFLELINGVSEEAFQKLSTSIISRNPFLKTALFYKAINAEDRKSFETLLGKQHKDAHLIESSPSGPGTDGGLRPAGIRSHYLPIWLADQETCKTAYYGWDVLSDPSRADAASEALKSNVTRASKSFLLDDGHAAIEVFVPVAGATRKIQGILGLTMDLTALLGAEEWRRNVTVSLSTGLSGGAEFLRLFRSLDKIETSGPILATLRQEIVEQSFGQVLKLEFERQLDFHKINSLILIVTFLFSITLAILAVGLVRTLSDLARVNEGLERTVDERTRDLRNVLDNINQGFFTFDRHGKVGSTVSRGAREIFGESLSGKSLSEVLQSNEAEKAFLPQWFELLFEGKSSFGFADLVPLGPKTFSGKKDCYIEIGYFPVYKEGGKRLEAVIGVASDKTNENRLEADVQREQAQAKMILRITEDRSAFADFVEEIRSIFINLKKDLEDRNQSGIMRGLHTIKGGAALYSMTDITSFAHSLESTVVKEGLKDIDHLIQQVLQLNEIFEKFLAANEAITGPLGDQNLRMRSFNFSYLVQWGEKLKTIQEPTLFEDYKTTFLLDDLVHTFKRFDQVIQKLALDQDKQVKLILPDQGPKVQLSRYKGLLSSFVHVFRNSVDHGLEDIDAREASGKDPTGTIIVSFEEGSNPQLGQRSQTIKISVRDDGKGIDPAIIRSKAVEKNLLSAEQVAKLSDEEAIQLVFENGFSTRDAVSEVSGRGVGLDALRFEANSLGGQVSVRSEKGKGSLFLVEIPLLRV